MTLFNPVIEEQQEIFNSIPEREKQKNNKKHFSKLFPALRYEQDNIPLN